MKKFKQFRSEQEVLNEVGPIGATMMAAMGIFGGGLAAYKLFKKSKEVIKGYKETKAEKKDNKENGVYVQIKKWDANEGKITTQSVELAAPGSRKANMSNEERDKKKKELQKKEDPINDRMQAAHDEEERIKDKEEKEKALGTKDKADAGKSVSDWMGTEVDKIPDGIKPKEKEKERKEIGGHKDVLAYMDRWEVDSVKGWKKWFDDPKDKDDFEYVDPKEWEKRYTKGGAAKFGQRPKIGESRLLKFGEFITEGVMDDLKKASKSRKDSEITLDDGADIPIDPLTASILVKYIEGLGSSEKNKIINKIQRTERAFMKVLGQAHGE